MTLIHSKDYVLKVAHELNYTIEDVRSQVSRGLDGNLSTEEAVFFYTDDMRYILTFNMNKSLATQLLREVREDWSVRGIQSNKKRYRH